MKDITVLTARAIFVLTGQPNEHDKSQQGIRAIAHVNGNIWIADEDLSSIVLADELSGRIQELIPVETPIGLYYHEGMKLVFVSCKSKTRGGVVYGFDSETYQIVHTYVSDQMIHPTGAYREHEYDVFIDFPYGCYN
jgi:hypothetical protein